MTAGYQSTIDRLESLARLPFVPARQVGLARTAVLLEELGNPHRSFRSVHVAGSSGKGSTTTMIASILRSAGYRVGCFRSPHLVSYTERINVAATDISPAAWNDVFERVWPIVKDMSANSLPQYRLGRPALFDVIFAMAALYFADQGVDLAVIETGLGGRFDATNVLSSDVAVITTISLEHTRILGSTVAEIAAEKAAIIKAGCTAVSGVRDPDARRVIEARADEVGASLIRVPEDVKATVESQDAGGTDVRIEGPFSLSARLGLVGGFQADNAATAVGACAALIERGIAIDVPAIVHGLEAARVPGRFEIVQQRPLVILDGAHHPDAAETFGRSLDALLGSRRIVMLFTALEDKDAESMARSLGTRADSVIITRAPGTARAAETDILASHFRAFTERVAVVEDPLAAMERALAQTTVDDVLVICGSLYLVGLARQRLASAVTS